MSVIMTSPPHLTDAFHASVAPTTGCFPVDVVEMTRVFLTIDLRVSVTWFLRDVGTMHLAVVLMVVRNDTTESGVSTVSVWDGTVEGGVGGAFAVVTPVELRAMPCVMGGVGDFAMETLVWARGARSGWRGFCGDVRLGAP